MEHFSEDHSKLLLSKEWLVKIDNQKSTPYLFKFYLSTIDLSCFVLVTDTKAAWAEVLTSKQIARRWRDCNPLNVNVTTTTESDEREDAWRLDILNLLGKVHTLGGIADMSFEVVDSNYADFSFELECDDFKWRWDTCFLGYKPSSEIISKHLIMPLISVNHLAFTSTDKVSELSEGDLEKAVDKVGRTARRTLDTHVKNAISKPRLATTLRRMTALFNFVPDLPAIVSSAERPEMEVPRLPAPTIPQPIPKRSDVLDVNVDLKPVIPTTSAHESDLRRKPTPTPKHQTPIPTPKTTNAETDSATESESEEDPNPNPNADAVKGKSRAVDRSVSPKPPLTLKRHIASVSPSPIPAPSGRSKAPKSDSGSDSPSPPRPTKKAKKPQISSSEEDSEEDGDRKKRGGGAGGRGTRQPIKRGGKRF